MEPRIGKTVIDYLRKQHYEIYPELEGIINNLLDHARDNRDLMVRRGYNRQGLVFKLEEITEYLVKEELVWFRKV